MIKLRNKFLLLIIVILMTFSSMPASYIYADELPNSTPVLFPYINEDDLAAKIINSPEFISKYATFAHYLGFGWCGGTASKYVGQDFEFRKSGNDYILQARYNASDPYASGFWADKRLKMTISNIRFYIAPETLKTGTEKITDLEPIVAQRYEAVNRGDTEDSASANFTYNKSKTVSHTTNYSFQEGIHTKSTAKIDVLFFSGAMEYGWNFTANQGWSDSTSTVDSSTVSTNYTTSVPAKSKRTIKLMSYKTKSEVPYTANIYMDYDITYSGFLRWGGNARTDHPKDRPFVNVTFGSKDLSATEQIEKMFTNRSIPGYSQWDWNWMNNEYGANNVKSIVSSICRRPMGAATSGVFSAVDGTNVQVIAEDAISLTPEELNNMNIVTDKSLKPFYVNDSNTKLPGITIKNVMYNNTPELKVLNTQITTKNGVINLINK